MVKHVILWKLDESKTKEEKDTYVRPFTIERTCVDYEI